MHKSKKLCFITLGNLYLCPYIKKYIELIDCKYDIIYWDRHNLKENFDGADNVYAFNLGLKEGSSKIQKLRGYIEFAEYGKKILLNEKYDGLILLQTSAGVLFYKTLQKQYYKKYILDIRDYTMEKNPVFYKLVSKLIKNSYKTVISSEGYKAFLPDYNYVLTHNNFKLTNEIAMMFNTRKRENKKIVISYIGLIRFHEMNKKLIKMFGNDVRFEIRFIGKDALLLKKFCDDDKITNVKLIDRFPPEKTLDYYYDTDIICNVYGNNSPLLDYALSNKLYYASQLNIPILVSPNTYMETISSQYNFGITLDVNSKIAVDHVYNSFIDMDYIKLKKGCSAYNQKVNLDNAFFEKNVLGFFKEI
jgi:hypothetical protein